MSAQILQKMRILLTAEIIKVNPQKQEYKCLKPIRLYLRWPKLNYGTNDEMFNPGRK